MIIHCALLNWQHITSSVTGAPASMVLSHDFTSLGARRQAAKQQLATGAQQLLQAPEKQLPQLKALLQLLEDKDAQVHAPLLSFC